MEEIQGRYMGDLRRYGGDMTWEESCSEERRKVETSFCDKAWLGVGVRVRVRVRGRVRVRVGVGVGVRVIANPNPNQRQPWRHPCRRAEVQWPCTQHTAQQCAHAVGQPTEGLERNGADSRSMRARRRESLRKSLSLCRRSSKGWYGTRNGTRRAPPPLGAADARR